MLVQGVLERIVYGYSGMEAGRFAADFGAKIPVDAKSGAHNVLVPDDLAVAKFPILRFHAKLNSKLGSCEPVGWS